MYAIRSYYVNDALFKGVQLKDAEIEVYQLGGKLGEAQLVDEYQFKDVQISELSSSDLTDNGLSFAYGAFTHAHVEMDGKGGVSGVDIAGSTEKAAALGDARWRDVLGQFHKTVGDTLERFRGRLIDTAGDGVFASFDGPARAIP